MADRYWRGGSGTWNTSNTANWSTTSGGAGGASVPTFADSVFFDQAGTYTVTLTGTPQCAGITVSAGTVTFSGTGTPVIYGSMSLIAGTLWPATGAIIFSGAGAGNTILTNGVSFAAPISISGGSMGTTTGVWGEYTLQSSLTLVSAVLTLSSGRFNTAGYAITAANIVHTAGCYDFGSPSSTITWTGGSTVLTLYSDGSRSWVGRPNIIGTPAGTATQTITAANGSLGSLTIGGSSTGTFTINGGVFSSITQTRNIAFTVTFGTTYPVILESWGLAGVSTSVRLTVSGTVYLMSRPASGVAAYLSSTLNCYGCPIYADTGSVVTSGYGVFASAWQAPVTPKYWVGGAGDWSNTAKWSTTSGGAGGTPIPWADEDVIFDANSGAGAFAITTASAKLAHRDFTCTRSNITLSTYTSHLTNIVITGNINSLTAYNPGSYFNGITVWGGTGPKTYVGNSLFCQNAGALHLIGSSYTFSQAVTIVATTYLYNGSFNPGIYNITWGATGQGAGLYTFSGDAKAWNNGSSTTRTNFFRNFAPFNTTIQASTANIIFATDTSTYFDLGINTTWGGSFTILGSGGGQDANIVGVNSTISNVVFTANISGVLSFTGGITIAGGNLIGGSGSVNFNSGGTYLTNSTTVVFTGSTNVSLSPSSWGANAASVTFSNSGYTRFYFPAAATTILPSQTVVFNITPSFNLQTGNTASTTYALPPSATYNAGCTIIFGSSVNAEVTVRIPASTIAGTLAINNGSSTYSGTVTFTGNVTANTAITNSTLNAGARILFNSNVAGTQRTLSTPSITLSNINFKDIFASGAAIPWSGSSFGNLGNNTNITFSAPRNVYWNLAGTMNWTANGWAATSGGVPAASNYPLPQDTAVFDNAGAMGTVVLTGTVQVAGIDASARTLPGGISAASSQTLNFTSSIVLGTGLTNLANIVFTSITSPTTFTSAGRTIASLIANTSVTLNDSMIASGSIGVYSPATLNTQGYNVTAGNLITFSGSTVNGGSGASPTLTLTSSGTSIAGAVSGSVFNVIASYGASNIFRPPGSQNTYGTFTWTNTTASDTIIIGGGSFSSISRTGTAAQTISFNPAYAFSCTNFNLTGSVGNVLTLNSSTAGTAASVNISSGSLAAGYLSVRDIAFTPAPAANGSSPYVLYAGTTSTSLGNVTGLLFQNGGVGAVKAYLITTTGAGTWTVPSDWNPSSNTIHLVGGGGGGGGGAQYTSNNRAGGGGGGGGYRAVANYGAAAGSSVSFAVGAGGTAGALGFSTGGTGGTTSWASGFYTATGGTGGNSAIGSPGGTGGTGDYTGGTGGNGANTSSTWAGVGSGGGGGAAGPGYAGKNGGNGAANSTFNSGAGGGGGGAGGALSTAGSNATATVGGAGGKGPAGTGGGTSGGGAGSNGGGGGGSSTGVGGVGGASTTIAGSFGPSGGPGGCAGTSGIAGVAGTWGAGGSGGAPGTSSGNSVGGAGGQGFIFIFYTPPTGTVYTGTVTETATYADLAYAAYIISRTIAETATSSDAITASGQFVSFLTDTATYSDAITASGQFVSFLTDTATYSDVTTANNLLTVSVSDAATYSDSVVVQAGLTAAVLDTAMYSETIRATATFFAAAQEQGTGLDAVLAKVQFLSSVVNTATVSDVDFALAVWATSVADSALVVGSAAVAASVFNPVVLQPATALDTPSASHVMIAQSIDNMAISDLMSARFLWEPIDDSETANWTGVVSTQSAGWAQVDDSQAITWQNVPATQTPGWAEVDDAQTPGWTTIQQNP